MDIAVKARNHKGMLKRTWKSRVESKSEKEFILYSGQKLHVSFPDGTYKDFPYVFREHYLIGQWFNALETYKDGIFVHWYVNIASPPEMTHEEIIYTDFDLDFVVFPDHTFKILDQDEFDQNKIHYATDDRIYVERATEQVKLLIKAKSYPFKLPQS